MSWLLFNPRYPDAIAKEHFATDAEIRRAFKENHDMLQWRAELITGDAIKAKNAICAAAGLGRTTSGVLRDWVVPWAYSATMRTATAAVHGSIVASAPKYANAHCEHSYHQYLSEGQVTALRQLGPEKLQELDALARAALVVRGMQKTSISECAMLFDVPRRTVIPAYCHALEWLDRVSEVHEAGSTDERWSDVGLSLSE